MRIKIAAAAVTAAMLLLSGCKSAEVPDGTADTAETTAAEILLGGENAPDYTIIRGDNARKGELDAVRLVRDRLKECGMEMKISTDWEGNPVSDCEIVIGDTLRDEDETEETVHADILSLRSEEYLVRVCGSRIYIAGGSDESLLQAAEHFLSGFFSDPGDGKISLPREYSFIKRKEYPIKTLTVNGKSLQEFCLVRDAFLDQETADILSF